MILKLEKILNEIKKIVIIKRKDGLIGLYEI